MENEFEQQQQQQQQPFSLLQFLTTTLVHQADSASMLDFSSSNANSIDILMRQVDFFWNELPGTSSVSMDLRIDISYSSNELSKAYKQCISKRGILHFFDPNLLSPFSKALLVLQETNSTLNSFDESELMNVLLSPNNNGIDFKSTRQNDEIPLVVVISNNPSRLSQFFFNLKHVKSVLSIPTSLAFPFIHEFYTNLFQNNNITTTTTTTTTTTMDTFHSSLNSSFSFAIQFINQEQRSQVQLLSKKKENEIVENQFLFQIGHTRISIPRIPISNIALAVILLL